MPDTLDGLSMSLERANLDKLRAVFSECFAEDKLDIDKLLGLCEGQRQLGVNRNL